jgi:hypothetical protein
VDVATAIEAFEDAALKLAEVAVANLLPLRGGLFTVDAVGAGGGLNRFHHGVDDPRSLMRLRL